MQQAAAAEDYTAAATQRDALNMLKLQQRKIELEVDKEARIIRYEIGENCERRNMAAASANVVFTEMGEETAETEAFEAAEGYHTSRIRLAEHWANACSVKALDERHHQLMTCWSLHNAGMVIRHRRYTYRGVIVGHDDHCSAPEAWIQVHLFLTCALNQFVATASTALSFANRGWRASGTGTRCTILSAIPTHPCPALQHMGVDSLLQGRRQPFYHVLWRTRKIGRCVPRVHGKTDYF